MRPMIDMDTVQIDITSRCSRSCANCTHLCGHFPKQFDMDFATFKKAVDSLECYPKMVGFIGGDPLLHPQFEKFCRYAAAKIPKEKLGLWTCLPTGKEKYRETICATFGHIFINDHTRDDILHSPVLVAARDMQIASWQKDYLINKCWVQNSWSASVNPKGAWFCEVAGALAMLLDVKNLGWEVTQGWWLRSPQHFIAQMALCEYCGCAMPLKRRPSTDKVDDISPGMREILDKISPRVKAGKCAVSDCTVYTGTEGQLATYKDLSYRDEIARRYGLFLTANEQGFQTPHLMRKWKEGNHGA